ncbi:elongation factor Tu [Priestia megaterium]
MIKEVIERTKPLVNIGFIGHIDHGKTTLATAISSFLSLKNGSKQISDANTNYVTEERERSITIGTRHIEEETDYRHYCFIDYSSHADIVKDMIKGSTQMDGAILVLAADSGLEQLSKQILLAHYVGVSHLIIFLNKIDVTDSEEVEFIEEEVISALTSYGYPEDTPIIKASAYKDAIALENGQNAESIPRLINTLDSYIPQLEHSIDKPFLMPIEGISSAQDRGTVVTGRIEQGKLKKNEALEIVGINETTKTTCTDIEMLNKFLTEAEAGENVRLFLSDIDHTAIQAGQVLAEPGSISPHTKFKATIYSLSREQGGRHAPFFTNYRPQFHFRTTDVTGYIHLGKELEMVMPDDNAVITVELTTPIAMTSGLRFAIREGSIMVGVGRVIEVLE